MGKIGLLLIVLLASCNKSRIYYHSEDIDHTVDSAKVSMDFWVQQKAARFCTEYGYTSYEILSKKCNFHENKIFSKDSQLYYECVVEVECSKTIQETFNKISNCLG
jgi:hypothetical protein